MQSIVNDFDDYPLGANWQDDTEFRIVVKTMLVIPGRSTLLSPLPEEHYRLLGVLDALLIFINAK